MNVIPRLHELHSEMTAWRRELHAHPQTAFEETFASDLIASKLTSWGIDTHRGLARTGVVGTILGQAPGAGQKASCVGLRADIDAPIKRQNPATQSRVLSQGNRPPVGSLLGITSFDQENIGWQGELARRCFHRLIRPAICATAEHPVRVEFWGLMESGAGSACSAPAETRDFDSKAVAIELSRQAGSVPMAFTHSSFLLSYVG